MADQLQRDEHETIDRLLPWYVNNTLDPADFDRVQRHLTGCGECRANVALLSVVQNTVRHDTTTPIVPPPRTDRLLAAIDAPDARERRPPWLTASIVAVASLGAVLLSVVLWLAARTPVEPPAALYETATAASRQPAMDYVLSVQFKPGILLADQQKVLRDLSAKEINRSEQADGTYRVTVSLEATSLAELERFTNDVEAIPEVQSASVVALQLPMERRQ